MLRQNADVPPWERWAVIAIVLLHVVLSTGYSLGPIMEGPDEFGHYSYILTLTEKGGLPNAFTDPWPMQYHHAPLYYVLAAPISLLAGPVDLPAIEAQSNPFAGYEIGAPGNDNKNVFLHPRREAFPYSESQSARAIHLIRLLSVVLGTLTVILSYMVFRLLWPARPDLRIAALGLAAFWPQMTYLSGMINNDNLLYLMATLVLLLLLRQQRDGPSLKHALWIGGAFGLALLTKINALFLLVPLGVAYLLDRRAWRFLPVALGAAALISGWWFVRNLTLYGDLTASRALRLAGQRGDLASADLFSFAVNSGPLQRLPAAYASLWARFGPNTVAVEGWIYRFFDVLLVATVVGLVLAAVKRFRAGRPDRPLRDRAALLGSFALIWPLLLVYYSSRAWAGAQGRYVLPGIAAWGIGFALGLDGWLPRRFKLPASLASAGLLGVVGIVCLVGDYFPAYRPQPAPDAIPHPLSYRFGDAAELIGVSHDLVRAQPGDRLRITLTWRALETSGDSLQVYLHTVDSELVRRDSFPGTGNLLSTDWQPGETWAETFVITIPQGAEQQHAHPLIAGLVNVETGAVLPARVGNEEVVPYVGQLVISGPIAPFDPLYRFGDVIGMDEPEIDLSPDSARICVRWLSLAPAELDYHVFIHALAPDGTLLAQTDVVPHNGAYPTQFWLPGEVVEDCAALDIGGLPSTGWQIGIGLYDWTTGERLPAFDHEDNRVPNDTVILVPNNR